MICCPADDDAMYSILPVVHTAVVVIGRLGLRYYVYLNAATVYVHPEKLGRR